MNILDQICERKKEHVLKMKQKHSLSDLEDQIQDSVSPPFLFEKALQIEKDKKTPSIIAEIKKASPSKGLIRKDFSPKIIAKNYEASGATCISCLTDEPYFQGHDTYLKEVKNVSFCPVLRKDFMVDLYQIYESRALGADAILLIMAALNDTLAGEMYELATELGMSTLFEIHNRIELDRALQLNPHIVGINNRNLKTMDVSLETSNELVSFLPDHIIRISESGISSAQDIMKLTQNGFDGFLIGESLMKQDDEAQTLKHLKDAIFEHYV